jgi:hypothetical protein
MAKPSPTIIHKLGLNHPLINYAYDRVNPRRSPLAPLKKWGTGLLVPLFKGDLGGSLGFTPK